MIRGRAGVGLLATVVLIVGAGCQQPRPVVPGPDSASETTRDLLSRADERAGAAETESALRMYRSATEHDPSSVPAHLRYVGQMLELGRLTEVRAEYVARAATTDATDAERTMSERLSTNGASSALRRVYTNAADRSPQSPWWYLALAEVEIAEADAWNQRRLEAVRRGDRDDETQAFEQARGALKRAFAAVNRAADRSPALAEVELYRGYLRATEGDVHTSTNARSAAYAAAEAAFSRATALDADLVEAWAGLGDVRFRAGNIGGSLGAFSEAVRRMPTNADYRESLGVVLHDADRHSEAARQFRAAARLRSWDATPLVRLGDALADGERWQDALDAYDEALRRDPGAVEAHYKKGVVLEHIGRTGEARAAFARYVDLDGPRARSVTRRIDRLLREEQR